MMSGRAMCGRAVPRRAMQVAAPRFLGFGKFDITSMLVSSRGSS